MTKVFLSYRKADEATEAALLTHGLKSPYEVFNDFDIVSGRSFEEAIDEALRRSDVVVVLIGRSWLAQRSGDVDERDWKTKEVAKALSLSIPVLPVLLAGTRPLARSQLPPNVAALADIQAISFDPATNGTAAAIADVTAAIDRLLAAAADALWRGVLAGVDQSAQDVIRVAAEIGAEAPGDVFVTFTNLLLALTESFDGDSSRLRSSLARRAPLARDLIRRDATANWGPGNHALRVDQLTRRPTARPAARWPTGRKDSVSRSAVRMLGTARKDVATVRVVDLIRAYFGAKLPDDHQEQMKRWGLDDTVRAEIWADVRGPRRPRSEVAEAPVAARVRTKPEPFPPLDWIPFPRTLISLTAVLVVVALSFEVVDWVKSNATPEAISTPTPPAAAF